MSAGGADGDDAEQADDLFGRWLAHHAQQTTEDEKEYAAELARGGTEAPAPESRPSNDMDRQVPGFEPIIMPSVRKKQEQSPASRRGLLRNRRGSDAADEAAAGPLSSRGIQAAPGYDAPYAAPLSAAPPPPAARRPARSTSGQEPDWLRELRDPGPDAHEDSASDVPEEVASVEVDGQDDDQDDVVEAELVEAELVEAEPVDDEAATDEMAAGEGWLIEPREPAGADERAADEATGQTPPVHPETEPEATAEPVDDTAGAPADPEPEPATSAAGNLDWLAIIRDPGSRYAPDDTRAAEPDAAEPAAEPDAAEPAAEPDAAEPAAEPDAAEPAAEPDAAEPAAEPDAAEPAAEPDAAEPAAEMHPEPEPAALTKSDAEESGEPTTGPSAWVTRLKGPSTAATADPVIQPETPPAAVADPAPVRTEPDWKSRFRQAVEHDAPVEPPAPEQDDATAEAPDDGSDAVPASVVEEPAAEADDVPGAEPQVEPLEDDLRGDAAEPVAETPDEPVANTPDTLVPAGPEAEAVDQESDAEPVAAELEPEPVAPEPVASEPEPEPEPEKQPAAVAAEAAPSTVKVEQATRAASARTAPMMSMPDVHTFAPRRRTRTLVTAVLALGVLVTLFLAYRAYHEPSQSTVALAAVAAFVTAIVWAVRTSTAVTVLTVRKGQLEVVRDSNRFVVDLTNPATPLELVGTPGERGWKALFVRRGMPPFEVTPAMVDPEEFTRVVRFYRPGEPT